MKRVPSLWRLFPFIAGMAFILTGCGVENISALTPKGPVAREQYWLMKLSLGVMVIVVVVVFLLTIFVLIKFRHRKGQTEIPKQVEGNHKLEIAWTVIPICLLIVLIIPMMKSTFTLAEDYTDDPNAIHVKVTGHQFWWQFDYPKEGISTAQDLVIPVGKKIAIDLESSDVNHSFWVPALAGKTDNNPGLTNAMYIEADEPGVYYGFCAELCGWSHAYMLFKVRALPQDEYTAWVDNLKAPATIPEEAQAGEEIFKAQCLACHAVDSNSPSVAGPNLDGFADRLRIAGFLDHTDENLHDWIKDPQTMKPKTNMPTLGLSDDDISELVKYLHALK